ncbi:MAG: outer membrane beta-barrel protein, partial [Verrucomicrobia bacterium]|nr:outer membrane beta-barrel protein [Cytophagales bacterium]
QGRGSSDYNNWYSPVLILKYALSEKVTLAARVENYTDKNGVIIGLQDFNTNGYSLNLDISPVKNVVWRLEGRLFDNQEKIFTDADSQASNTSAFVGTSLAISF